MKQLIVMFATIILGIAVFQMIAGGGEGSVYNVVKNAWVEEIHRF